MTEKREKLVIDLRSEEDFSKETYPQAKVQHFSGISKRIPFEGFDFYDLFRVTFENSELGRMKRLLPLHEMAVHEYPIQPCGEPDTPSSSCIC